MASSSSSSSSRGAGGAGGGGRPHPRAKLLPLKSDAPDRDPDAHEALVVGLAPWNLAVAKALAGAGTDAERARRRVTTADALPLADDDERGAFELVVVVVSASSRLSLERARDVVKAMGAERANFVIGRWVLVACNVSRTADLSVPVDDIAAFAHRHQLPLMYCDSEAEASLAACGARLAAMLAHAARDLGLSPMLAPATDVWAKRRP